MRPVLRALAAALVLTALSGCGDSNPSPPTPEDLQDIDLSADRTIVVDDDGYDPSELEVTAGEVLRLVNEGETEHSFTADDRAIDTGLMQPGEDTTLVLTKPTVIHFYDLGNPDHVGTLTVLPQD
jgi:plastocyanin